MLRKSCNLLWRDARHLIRPAGPARVFLAANSTRFIARANHTSATMKEEISNLIAQNHVFVASKSYCPFCRRTKQLLADLDVEAKIVELDEVPNGDQLQLALKELSGQGSVPNIYIGGDHIGGNSDLQELYSSGELLKLLNKSKL